MKRKQRNLNLDYTFRINWNVTKDLVKTYYFTLKNTKKINRKKGKIPKIKTPNSNKKNNKKINNEKKIQKNSKSISKN